MKSVFALCFTLSLITVTVTPARAEAPMQPQACVVLLHGLWRTGMSMKGLQWGLAEAGFGVANTTYPSLRYPIEELAVMAVEAGLAECREQGLEVIHFVTHSLGGILVRQYMLEREIPGLRRVVMLGPPNQGSRVADAVHDMDALRPITPQVVEQLGTGEQSVPLRLGPVNFELGVIAGTSSAFPMVPGVLTGDSDGTVAVAETVVPGMLDFLEMPVGHTFMMWDDSVLRQVIHFLRHGAFDRSGVSPPG